MVGGPLWRWAIIKEWWILTSCVVVLILAGGFV